MTNTTMKYLNIIFIPILICLSAQIGQAQTLGSLYSSNQKVEALFIEKNTNMEQALEAMEERFNILFIYRSEIIKDSRVENEIILTNGIENTLDKLFEGTDLEYANLKHKTYGIYTRKEDNPESLTLPIFQETVTGTVIEAQSGAVLPGVNVVVEGSAEVTGTTIGTTTNMNGTYEIELPENLNTLVFSYIGYESLRIDVNGRTEINVELEPSLILGQEMVVTALGIDRESRSLGYATSTVDTDEITINRSPNFMDALQGKMAGVNVSSMAGSGPQGSSKIRIRGQSSFGANNSPLIVVDGVPIDNTTSGVSGDISERGSNRNSDSGDGLSSINPDNIENISVLKGAAAAALYGARAKDGVIMITTRNRAEGSGVQVEFNSNFTFERPIDRRDYQFEYGQGEGGQRPTSPFPTSGVWSFGEKFEPGMTHTLFDGLEVPYEPQKNQLREYYQNGYNLNNTITVSQGGENGGFNVSVSNLSTESILPGSTYERNTISLGFTQTVAEKLTVTGNINYSNEDRQNPPNIAEQDYSPVVIYTLASSMPMDVLEANAFTEEGNETLWSRFTNRTNPYFALSRFENNERDRVFGNLTARLALTDWLTLQGRLGQDYYSREQDYNLPTGSQRQAPAPPGFVNGQYVQDQRSFRELNADFLVMANQNFGNYAVNANIGGNMMHRRSDRYNVLVQDFFTRGLYAIGNGRVKDPQTDISERQVNSIYGTGEISYNGLFFLNATLRNDWFSTLSPENRSVLYPSLSTSFIFSDLFEDALPDWVTYGKLRASYAEVGSDTDVPPYASNLNYSINNQLFNNQPIGGISGNQVPNPNLRPMRVSEWEFGIDLTLFNNLSLELSYYNKTSKDQILNQQISNVSGFTSQLINIGEAQNKGVEMMVNFAPIQNNNFRWNLNVNASYNTSEVIDLGEEIGVNEITVGSAEFHGELRQVTGMPMNQLYGWGWLRDEQGRQVFNASNGLPLRSEEQLNFGSSIPDWVGGIYNTFNYKAISMSFLIDFKLGHNLISGTHINAYRHGLDKATLVGREQGFVVGDGVNPDGSVNATQAEVQSFYESIRTFRLSEESVFNAGSWQLRQITLGYDFTSHLPDNLGLRGLRVSAVANNVAVLKNWVPHVHPDQNGIISDRRQGLESTGLPVTTSIGFNVNVQF